MVVHPKKAPSPSKVQLMGSLFEDQAIFSLCLNQFRVYEWEEHLGGLCKCVYASFGMFN